MHVKNLVAELNSRGETTQDLLVNLFKGYAVASDKTFRGYIQTKEDTYDEKGDVNPNELMQLASNKFKVLVDKGLWNAPTAEEEKIVALEAKIKSLSRKQTNDHSKNKTSKRKESPNKDNKQQQKKKYTKPVWKTTPPKEGERSEKDNNSRKYHWCPKHKMWTVHSPQECKGTGYNLVTQKKKEEKKSSNANQDTIDVEDLVEASTLEILHDEGYNNQSLKVDGYEY